MTQPGLWTPKGIVAVVDTSVHVRAYLAAAGSSSPSAQVQEQAGYAYDSFTSPEILDETERVLVREFGAQPERVRRWLDQFGRQSRQVDPDRIPGDFAAQLRGDERDNPVLKTALAVYPHDPEGQEAVSAAMADAGLFIVSTNTRHFPPGRNLYGWTCIRPHELLARLEEHGELRARGSQSDR